MKSTNPDPASLAGASSAVVLVALTVCGHTLPAAAAPAPTAELAKQCRAMAVKAYPTRPPGSKVGTEQAQRDYYRDCIAKNGNMDSGNAEKGKPKTR